MFAYDFMQHAFAAVTIVALVSGPGWVFAGFARADVNRSRAIARRVYRGDWGGSWLAFPRSGVWCCSRSRPG